MISNKEEALHSLQIFTHCIVSLKARRKWEPTKVKKRQQKSRTRHLVHAAWVATVVYKFWNLLNSKKKWLTKTVRTIKLGMLDLEVLSLYSCQQNFESAENKEKMAIKKNGDARPCRAELLSSCRSFEISLMKKKVRNPRHA